MLNIYTSFLCVKCKGEFVLLTEELEINKAKGKYISCPYCNSKNIREQKADDSLKECMKERSYKRINGRVRQK